MIVSSIVLRDDRLRVRGRAPEKLYGPATVGSATPETFSTKERLFRTVVGQVLISVMGNERIFTAAVWAERKLLGEESTGDVGQPERLRVGHDCDTPELSPSDRSKVP